MRDRHTHSVTQTLIVFLFKLRAGNSNMVLASILKIKHEQTIPGYSKAVLKSFEEDMLPHHFGITSSIRENHTPDIAKNSFDI